MHTPHHDCNYNGKVFSTTWHNSATHNSTAALTAEMGNQTVISAGSYTQTHTKHFKIHKYNFMYVQLYY